MTIQKDLVKYDNPVIPGFAPDPSVVYVDGIFYLATSSFHVFPGIPIYTSRDLREWKHIGNAINRPEQLNLDGAEMRKMPLDTGHFMVGAGGLFAPTIRYHEGTFYIICTNLPSFEPPIRFENFIISTTDIWAGTWSDPVPVEFSGIDPSLFFDDDGKVYFQGAYFHARQQQPSTTIMQFEINTKTGERMSEQREIWQGHARYDTEGPHIYKVGKYYYLLVAEGGTFEHHMLCIGRSENIWGPYEDNKANPILTADGTDEYIQNMGHGELFQDGGGQWWVIGLGVRNENEGHPLGKDTYVAPLGRESFLASVQWPEGGWPTVSQPKMQFSARPVKSSVIETIKDTVEINDKFSKFVPSQNSENVFIRIPDLSKYEIPEDGSSKWVLHPTRGTFSDTHGTCTFVGRRQRSISAVAVASLDTTKLKTGIKTGLAYYKDNLRHVSITYDSTEKTVLCRAVSLDFDRVMPTQLALSDESPWVHFKITSDARKWVFLAQTSNTEVVSQASWTELGHVFAWELAAREMTGPLMGIFAHTNDSELENEAAEMMNYDVFSLD